MPALFLTNIKNDAPSPRFQGYVEGRMIYPSAEEGGTISQMNVDAGDDVQRNQTLFRQDTTLKDTQRQQAEARLREAQARLRNVRAPQQRPEEIEVLRATERRAATAVNLSALELARQRELFRKGVTSQALLEQAEAAHQRDSAAHAEIRQQIEAAGIGGRKNEIQAAEAAVDAAKAALAEVDRRLTKAEVKAPRDGRVEDVFYSAGEMVPAGTPVLALLPGGNLRIRFFVPVPSLSALSLGDEVLVMCDGCPPDIKARIAFIAREAEFTPPVIFSEEERSKLVFKVEARLIGNEHALPVGLPVTVAPTVDSE
ncbi:HlyD family efflux transporter periplasmic adaptor subunit [Chelativorans sp. AA-79]|uniref:HlyD family secretion protein n=1 Tax=Chelativorans sp. AA-79 TaxID=3028735 RepID=UPI0023F6B2C1|nr:HlyD family efflux transporter periplasmic adaptor subunit [Chelativorans sp. AA-79]WEX12302.1 HlyD family efflux transporter periplasmic adaptor subunit [Chelativorans sp. AA-79]